MSDNDTGTSITPAGPNAEDRNMAMLAHGLGILTWFVGPLIIWLVKKESSKFVEVEALEALNFQITMAIGWVIVFALTMVIIGVFVAPLLWIANLVFCIMGAVAASKGEHYKYPFTLRLMK